MVENGKTDNLMHFPLVLGIPGLAGAIPIEPWPATSVLRFGSALLVGVALLIWWMRERHMAAQLRAMRRLEGLYAELIAVSSPVEILHKLNAAAPAIAPDGRFGLYVYHRASNALDYVPFRLCPKPIGIRPDAPEGGMATGVALCFRNRTALAISDVRRSPLFTSDVEADLPRSVLFLPIFAQEEILGVMELVYETRPHVFRDEEQAAMGRLAHHTGTALRLQSQKSLQDQVVRTERLAAAGQMISGLAAELRAPLNSILEVTSELSRRTGSEYSSALRTISEQAERTSEMVAHLLSFGNEGPAELKPVDINGMLLGLLRLRASERKAKGIEIQPQILNQRVTVVGSRGQLERAFLSLLVHAEQVAAQARPAAMSISTSVVANRMLIKIGCPTDSLRNGSSDPFADSFNENGSEIGALGLARVVLQNHGGQLRILRAPARQLRFEIELPIKESSFTPSGAPGIESQQGDLRLTVLLVEPQTAVQKQIVDQLTQRGHRVVPVASGEEAADMAHRVKFDLSLCSSRLPGVTWIDYYERIRQRVGSFILLTEDCDSEFAKAFQAGDGFVLTKPVDVARLNRLLSVIEKRISHSSVAAS